MASARTVAADKSARPKPVPAANGSVTPFPQAETIKTVGVIGAGQMGTGIGIVASHVANKQVIFVDANESSLKKSQAFVHKWCQKEEAKERLTPEQSKQVVSRITWHDNLAALNNVDFVIEAVNENFELKKKIFT